MATYLPTYTDTSSPFDTSPSGCHTKRSLTTYVRYLYRTGPRRQPKVPGPSGASLGPINDGGGCTFTPQTAGVVLVRPVNVVGTAL